MGWIIFLAIVTGIVYLIYWWVRIYNRFVTNLVRAQQEKETITTFLQKRWDNLLAITATAKRYGMHENSTMKETIEMRGSAKEEAEKPTEYNLLRAVVEQYPTLKADQIYNSLMQRTSDIEDQVNQSRVGYNRSVQTYNTDIGRFPQNIVAVVHHFSRLEYVKFEKQESYSPSEITKVFAQ